MLQQPHASRAAGTHWDPNQYLKFSDHRLRPALELLDRVLLSAPASIYDLGCGTGKVTRLIAERWPDAAVHGLDNWETEYLQVLEGVDPVYEWVKATGLRPILNALEGAEHDRFVQEYKERLRGAYPRRGDGQTLFPFRRLFIVATV